MAAAESATVPELAELPYMAMAPVTTVTSHDVHTSIESKDDLQRLDDVDVRPVDQFPIRYSGTVPSNALQTIVVPRALANCQYWQ